MGVLCCQMEATELVTLMTRLGSRPAMYWCDYVLVQVRDDPA